MAIATGSQATAADVLQIAKSKIITAARGNDASGDVAYTGVGFKPQSIIALGTGSIYSTSVGVADVNLAENDMYTWYSGVYHPSGTEAFLLSLRNSGSGNDFQKAVLKTLDSDGFTLTWTKGGSGISGNVIFLCIGPQSI